MISNDGRLYFSEVTSDDIGYYYCLIYKPGQAMSQGKVSEPTHLKVIEGSKYANFRCGIYSNPRGLHTANNFHFISESS